MEIPRGLALLLLMVHLTREEMEEEEMKEEEEEEESAAPAQLPPGLCYALSKENMGPFVLLQYNS